MKKLLALAMVGAFAVAATRRWLPSRRQRAAGADEGLQRQGRDKKGDERKAFMSDCLAGKAAPVAQNAQQERMKDCNAKAADKKGDERKAFMSDCLSGKDPPAKMTQQEKMKACNTKAGDKKGDERKAFMSRCLKG